MVIISIATSFWIGYRRLGFATLELKNIKSIYSVNGEYKSQLVKNKTGGWICEIWSTPADGRQRPMTRNVQPFATLEEAIQMAQRYFAQLTGDDRYFAKEDILKVNKLN